LLAIADYVTGGGVADVLRGGLSRAGHLGTPANQAQCLDRVSRRGRLAI
jgi:hypothetical protein